MAPPASDADVLALMRRRLSGGVGLGPDRRLPPERDLAEELGIGRRALRRALAVLEAEGALWRRQGQGTFAAPPPVPRARRLAGASDHTNPAEIMEVRLEVEPVLARFAAIRASRLAIEALSGLAASAAASQSAAEYEARDSALHRAIAVAAGNSLFLAMFDAVDAVRAEDAWFTLRESTYSLARTERLASQHGEIVAAIERRDPREAEAAMRRHLSFVARDVAAPGAEREG